MKMKVNFLNYEFSSIPYESFQRQRPPFSQIYQVGNIPPTGNFPPGFNFPGGGFTPPGMPKSPPPNYIPSKKDKGVQLFGPGGGGLGTKAVSANSIRFCLFKFTYIWEVNGRSYWAFLLNVDRVSCIWIQMAG